MNGIRQKEMLVALEKAVSSGNITAVVPEDLEVEAHNTLWSESSRHELTLLKLMPSVPATNIAHEYTRITNYGYRRNSGFFGERSLPPETNFDSSRIVTNIKLMGEVGPTFLLAALEETQQALGTSGAQNIERVALRLNVLRKKNRNMYFSDTRRTRLGTSGLRFQGIAQLIQEGTDGTSGTSPYGDHVIDMEGEPLTIDTIREKATETLTMFGMLNTLIMDPFARADLEASIDSAQRLPLPIAAQAHMVGQMLGGLQTQGGVVWFETDNILTPKEAFGQYSTDLLDGAPSAPAIVSGAAAPSATSNWKAADAGNIYYMVTETVDEVEGLGTRWPAGASYQAVAAGDGVTLTITPSNPLADSFKVYRGTDADSANTDAWFIYEVANTGGGGSVAWKDDNLFRPNTSWAFGLRVKSAAEATIHGGYSDSYDRARLESAKYLEAKDDPQYTVTCANLGPAMGIMALASVLAEVDRPLMYSACAPEVRNPFQNIVFKNIGRA